MKFHLGVIRILGCLLVLSMVTGVPVYSNDEPIVPPEQIKRDLVGQAMGGRAKAWKFQSVDQIRRLTILEQTLDDEKLETVIDLILKDPRVDDSFQARAKVHYERKDSGYTIQYVGLLSMQKMD